MTGVELAPPWEIVWLSELEALPREPHPFPGLWHAALTVLSGPPNVGKTTLALALSHALLLGEPFLGLLPGPGRGGASERVAYVGLDSGALYEVTNRADALGIPRDRFALVRGAEGARPDDWLAIAKDCADRGARAMVVDNLVRMCALRGSVNDDHVVGPFLNALNMAGSRFGLNVLLLHHTSDKWNGGRKELGSTAIPAAARQRVFLSGSEVKRHLTTEPNDGLPIEMDLAFDFPNFVLLHKTEGHKTRNRRWDKKRQQADVYLSHSPQDRASEADLIRARLAAGDIRTPKAIRSSIDHQRNSGLLAIDASGAVVPGPNWGSR